MTRLQRLRACVSLAVGVSAPPTMGATPPEHFILGTWQFEVPGTHCTETHIYLRNGTRHATSGREVLVSKFTLSARAGVGGYYELTDTVVAANGQPDCSGGVTNVGATSTVYVAFMAPGDAMLQCREASFKNCYGPLKRVRGSDS